MKKDRLNNFQRQETARWLLNISQAVIVGGGGSIFVPGLDENIKVQIVSASVILALSLYVSAMYIGRRVK